MWLTVNEGGYLGCAFGSPRTVTLGVAIGLSPESTGIGNVIIAGTYAAFQNSSGSGDPVEVLDLRTGHRRSTPAGSAAGSDTGGEDVWSVHSLVCSTTGDAAWVAFDAVRSSPGALVYDLYTFGKNGLRLVDPGTGIDQQSLAHAGRTVYWTDDGQPRSTTMQ